MLRELSMVKSPARRLKDGYFDVFLLPLAGSEDGKIMTLFPGVYGDLSC
jgi:hypothetical protein